MSRYENLSVNWVTFENDKEKAIVTIPCEIVFVPERLLTVSYKEPGLKEPTIWKGEFQHGFYRLKRESKAGESGTANMYFDSCDRLEGFWWEGSYEGCWWIIIDEDPAV